MNQKKSRRKTSGSTNSTKSRDQSPGLSAAVDEDQKETLRLTDVVVPSNTVRTWASIWLCFHLVAIFLSFTSVVEPSGLHARLSELVHPYLSAGHFAADDRPVYLAHGVESEQSHRLEVTSDELTDIDDVERCQWRTVGSGDYSVPEASPGLAVSDRVARWLTTAATLAENDQPGVVAELLIPVAKHFADVNAMRIVRFPTDLDDVNATPVSPYVARIVRSEELVSLVQLTPKRLSSQAVSNAEKRTE